MLNGSRIQILAQQYLGKEVSIVIDRPIGSKHPEHNFVYELNYGYVPNTMAADDEEVDAYLIGVNEPIKSATGICIAIAHRKNDKEDKLIIAPKGQTFSKEEIKAAIHFQEQWFDTVIIGW